MHANAHAYSYEIGYTRIIHRLYMSVYTYMYTYTCPRT